MPVSLCVWRVRIGSFLPRSRKITVPNVQEWEVEKALLSQLNKGTDSNKCPDGQYEYAVPESDKHVGRKRRERIIDRPSLEQKSTHNQNFFHQTASPRQCINPNAEIASTGRTSKLHGTTESGMSVSVSLLGEVIQRSLNIFASCLDLEKDNVLECTHLIHKCKIVAASISGSLCHLYFAGMKIIRSGDIETNPGPNDVAGTSFLDDGECRILAQQIDPMYYTHIGVQLECDAKELKTIAEKHNGDKQQAICEILLHWKARQEDQSSASAVLRDKLRVVGLNAQADYLLHESESVQPREGMSEEAHARPPAVNYDLADTIESVVTANRERFRSVLQDKLKGNRSTGESSIRTKSKIMMCVEHHLYSGGFVKTAKEDFQETSMSFNLVDIHQIWEKLQKTKLPTPKSSTDAFVNYVSAVLLSVNDPDVLNVIEMDIISLSGFSHGNTIGNSIKALKQAVLPVIPTAISKIRSTEALATYIYCLFQTHCYNELVSLELTESSDRESLKIIDVLPLTVGDSANIKQNNPPEKGSPESHSEFIFRWREICKDQLKRLCGIYDIRLKNYRVSRIYHPALRLEISENFTVAKCRERLIHHYKTEVCKVQIMPWDKSSVEDVKDIYIPVTMFKKDSSGRNIGNHDKVKLQGSVEDIFRTKINDHLPFRIMLVAPAGKGKTTAVAKMAYDWAYCGRESPLSDVPLLFILRLRHLERNTSFGEALVEEYFKDIKGLSSEGLEHFVRQNQTLCWVIFDGLDEYCNTIAPYDNPTNSIITILHNKHIPKCRVLVTGRPHIEKDFEHGNLPVVYAKMEIEGFSKDNSRDYIRKFFKKEKKAEALINYLDNNELINELVSTPIFCLMACHLWSKDVLEGIESQTDLFNKVNIFLWHHLQIKGISTNSIDFDRTIGKLGKIALHGLLHDSNKLLFTPKDFLNNPKTLDAGCQLGIISKTSRLVFHLEDVSTSEITHIEFYHKLAQEHAAAKYIALNSGSLAMKLHMSEIDRVMRKISTKIEDYENLIRFMAGTRTTICNRLLESILLCDSLSNEDRYRILLDCSCESGGSSTKLSSYVLQIMKNDFIHLTAPTIYTVIGMKKLPLKIRGEIRRINITADKFSSDISQRLGANLQLCKHLRTVQIDIKGDNLPDKLFIEIPSLVWDLSSPHTAVFFKELDAHLKEQITEITITAHEISMDLAQRLATYLRPCKHLETLQLNMKVMCGECGEMEYYDVIRSMFQCLTNFIRLKSIEMEFDRTISQSTVASFAPYIKECLHNCTSLYDISLSFVAHHKRESLLFSSSQVKMINPSLPTVSILSVITDPLKKKDVSIHSDGMDYSDVLAYLFECLANVTSLNSIEMKLDRSITKSSVVAFASYFKEFLHNCTCLSNINMSFGSVPHKREVLLVSSTQLKMINPSLSTVSILSFLTHLLQEKEVYIHCDGVEYSDVLGYLFEFFATVKSLTTIEMEFEKTIPLSSLAAFAPYVQKCLHNCKNISKIIMSFEIYDNPESLLISPPLVKMNNPSLTTASILPFLSDWLKQKISSFALEHCSLPGTVIYDNLTFLSSIKCLSAFLVQDSNLPHFDPSYRIRSVKYLEVFRLEGESYTRLFPLFTNLKHIHINLSDPVKDITGFAGGLLRFEGNTLLRIRICIPKENVDFLTRALDTPLGKMVKAIKKNCKNIRCIDLDIGVPEESVLHFVKKCRTIDTIRDISVISRGQSNDLRRYLTSRQDDRQWKRRINVELTYGDVKTKKYNITHAGSSEEDE